MFFAAPPPAPGRYPVGDGDEREGDGLITQPSDGDMLTIHDRQPVVLLPDAASRWVDPDLTSAKAEELLQTQGLSTEVFTWYRVNKSVGNVRNNAPELIDSLPAPET